MSEIELARMDCGRSMLELGCKRRGRSQPRDEWVKVHGRIRSPDGEWTFADSALMIGELEKLGAWLQSWSRSPAEPTLGFLDGNLGFEVGPRGDGPRGDELLLRVCFRGEVSPPWIWGDSHAVWDEGYRLKLSLTREQLAEFGARVAWLVSG
jgi:hypothetical protein